MKLKRDLIKSVIALLVLLSFSSCQNIRKSGETTDDKISPSEAIPEVSISENKDTLCEEVNMNFINELIEIDSDGVIVPLNLDDVLAKVSMVTSNSTVSQLIDIFGKAPKNVVETNTYIYRYYSGEIIIDLWGNPLKKVFVWDGEDCIEISLNDS